MLQPVRVTVSRQSASRNFAPQTVKFPDKCIYRSPHRPSSAAWTWPTGSSTSPKRSSAPHAEPRPLRARVANRDFLDTSPGYRYRNTPMRLLRDRPASEAKPQTDESMAPCCLTCALLQVGQAPRAEDRSLDQSRIFGPWPSALSMASALSP